MSQVEMVGTESEKCADTVSDRLLTPQPVDGRPAEISTFRRLLPQFLSSWAPYLMCWNFGLALALPSIVVPAVIASSPNESISMTADQASWLASIVLIVQPIGNVISGILNEAIGRRSTMILINVVPMIAWTMLGMANTPATVYTAFTILGVGVGLSSAPMTYIGEICEPSIRGILLAAAGVFVTIGTFMICFLGVFWPWRLASFTCIVIPFLTTCIALFIPEAPIWLLSKNRLADARQSLRRLRGGVSNEAIADEFESLQQSYKQSQHCPTCGQPADQCKHVQPSLWSQFRVVLQMSTLKPLILVVCLFFLMQFSAVFSMRAYMVPVLQAHATIVDAKQFNSFLGVIGIAANVVIVVMIRQMGKRAIYLSSQIGNIVACLLLGVYGLKFFPHGWTSLNEDNQLAERTLEHSKHIPAEWSYLVVAMFVVMQFFVSNGVSSVPYFMLFEVFPFKSRSFCCALCTVINQIFGFIATKIYYDLERWLSLPGVLLFYGGLAIVGFIVMYLILPETEHRSLEDIEYHYSDDSKPITDINIRIGAKPAENPAKTNDLA